MTFGEFFLEWKLQAANQNAGKKNYTKDPNGPPSYNKPQYKDALKPHQLDKKKAEYQFMHNANQNVNAKTNAMYQRRAKNLPNDKQAQTTAAHLQRVVDMPRKETMKSKLRIVRND